MGGQRANGSCCLEKLLHKSVTITACRESKEGQQLWITKARTHPRGPSVYRCLPSEIQLSVQFGVLNITVFKRLTRSDSQLGLLVISLTS